MVKIKLRNTCLKDTQRSLFGHIFELLSKVPLCTSLKFFFVNLTFIYKITSTWTWKSSRKAFIPTISFCGIFGIYIWYTWRISEAPRYLLGGLEFKLLHLFPKFIFWWTTFGILYFCDALGLILDSEKIKRIEVICLMSKYAYVWLHSLKIIPDSVFRDQRSCPSTLHWSWGLYLGFSMCLIQPVEFLAL